MLWDSDLLSLLNLFLFFFERTFLDKLRERRPQAIEAPPISERTMSNTITDQNVLDISQVSYGKTPLICRAENSLIPAQVNIPMGNDSDLSGDETAFQPLATSTPIPGSISTFPVPSVAVQLPERLSSSDPNRTPSFSELVSGDPMLVIPVPNSGGSQTNKDADNRSPVAERTVQNNQKKFLEAEKSSGFSSGKENLLKSSIGVNNDDEGVDEDESDIEVEEENSVISSNPISNVTFPTGSSIEIINHEMTVEDD